MAVNGKGSPSNSGEGAENYKWEITDVEENFTDTSSDSENEVPKAFEPDVPRSGKRTYGILVDDMLTERRLKNAKLDEQLASLRSILPAGPPAPTEERYAVLMDAYQHIVKLQGYLDDLNTDLALLNTANLVNGRLPQEAHAGVKIMNMGSVDDISYEHPTVEVKRVEETLELHIACINRPGLLIDIVAALDAANLFVVHGSIVCRENVLFEALSLEKENKVLHSGLERPPVEAEDEALKDTILQVIRRETTDNNAK